MPRQDLPGQIRRDFPAIIPLNRPGRPHDIDGQVKFLAGPDGGWLTGQVIRVDGGQPLVRAFDARAWREPVFGRDAMRGLT